MKIIYRVLIALLITAFVGLAVTAIVKSEQQLSRGRAAIASADEFLARYETP